MIDTQKAEATEL